MDPVVVTGQKDIVERDSGDSDLRDFITATTTILVGQSLADGIVLDVEVRRVRRIVQKLYHLSEDQVEILFEDILGFLEVLGPADAVLEASRTLRTGTTPRQRDALMTHLWDIALSDGVLHRREAAYLLAVGNLLGVDTLPLPAEAVSQQLLTDATEAAGHLGHKVSRNHRHRT